MKALIIVLVLALTGCASTAYHAICKAEKPGYYYVTETHKNEGGQVRSRITLYKTDKNGGLKFVRVVKESR